MILTRQGNKRIISQEILIIFKTIIMNTKKANKVVLLQIDKKFVVEEYSNVEEALEDAKTAFQIYEGMKQATAYVATVVEGYVKRDGVLNQEKVYIDLVEQLTINNTRKELKDE